MTLSLSAITGSGSNDASGASLAASSVTATAGSMLFAHMGWVDTDNTFNVNSVTDGKNTWFPARAKTRNATQQYSTQLWYAFGVRAGATVVTANFSAATTFRRIGVREALSSNGSFWTDPLDQTNSGTGTSNAPSAGAVVPTRDGELVVACAAITTGTLGAGAGGFTLSVAPSVNVAMEHLIQTTAASATGAFTSTLSDNWCAQVASFKDVQPPPQYNRFPPPCVIYQLVLAVASRDAGVAGAVTQDADAALTATATVTAALNGTTKPVDSSLTATATITAALNGTTKPVDATLTATATITAAATVVKPVNASLTATATITPAATATKPVDSVLTGTATITPTAASTKPVDATLTGTATITPTGTSTKPVNASLTGTATISAAASAVKPVDAAVATTATVTPAATSTKPVDATLTATATITADATVGAPPKTFDAALTATATITADATVIKPVNAALTATATITAAATVGTPGAVNFDAALTVAATITAAMTIPGGGITPRSSLAETDRTNGVTAKSAGTTAHASGITPRSSLATTDH